MELKVVGDTLKDGGGEAAEPVVAKVLTAEGRFLQLDSEGFLELQPLPDQGTVLRVDLAKAMHSYVSQKWSECAELVKILFSPKPTRA